MPRIDLTRRQLLGAALAIRLPRKIRVAIIGADGHTAEVTDHLRDLPDVEFACYALSKPNPKWSGAKHYTDHRQMLDQEKLDVVAVTTDDGARAAAVLDCVSRKLNFVAEKPLARTREDYVRIKKAVLSSGVKMGLMLPLRYRPHFLAMRAVVDSGEIGEVVQLQGQKSYKAGADSGWKNRAESYSGTIPWVGIHMIDTMMFASRRKLVECAAFQTRIGWPELGVRENTASVLYRLDNHGTATLNCDYLRPDKAPTHDDDRLRVAGTKGVVEYQGSTGVMLMTGTAPPRAVPLPPAGSLFVDYLNATYNNATPTLSHDEIWAASEAAYAAREAAQKGGFVKI
ncbi:MAG: Gfo/Idh/MocA family oxidoreductase [Acidobacteria bacterium]|nr:Gfo/Idh/MocA family oxidoreductase [Acidobacteriota bacterium]